MAFDLQKLDAMLASYIEKKKLPGVSVAVRGPGGVVFEKGYGIADLETGRPIDENTVCGIASMSKSMTTLACCGVRNRTSSALHMRRIYPRSRSGWSFQPNSQVSRNIFRCWASVARPAPPPTLIAG